jgi:ABC-type sugar transport system ATPase subunit
VFGESLTFNVNLATNSSNRIRRWWPLVSMSKKRIVARDMMQRLAIKARSSESPVDRLSGGNQQKVVVAKWLRVRPKLLILDEPTVGVDVGAREEIYGLIRSWAENGTALLLISSDFDELSLCHRVAVVREGSITKIVDGASVTKEELTRMCYEAVGAHA